MVTTVTDYFWTLSAKWSVSAYRGTGRAADDVVQLCERHSASVTVKTTGQKSQPFGHVLGARAPSEVNRDWLLSVIDADAPGLPARVRITLVLDQGEDRPEIRFVAQAAPKIRRPVSR